MIEKYFEVVVTLLVFYFWFELVVVLRKPKDRVELDLWMIPAILTWPIMFFVIPYLAYIAPRKSK